MSLALIQESAKEVRRLAIAGSPLAVGDFRLKKLIPPLEQAGAKVPVFAQVANAIGELVNGTEADSATRLLSLSTLLNAILYTQGQTGGDGDYRELDTFTTNCSSTRTTARVLKPLVEALTSAGAGRLEVVKTAVERGVFNDLRLIEPSIRALEDSFPEMADLAADKILPGYGPGVVPLLKQKLDLKGKKGDARRLRVMHQLDATGSLELCKTALEEGSAEVKASAIACLGKHEECIPLVMEQANSKNKMLRAAALEALAEHDRPDVTKLFTGLINGKALDILARPFRALRNRQVLKALLSEGERVCGLILKGEGEALSRFAEILDCLEGRRDAEVEGFLLTCLNQCDKLAKMKPAKNSPIAGADLMERLASLLYVIGSPKTLEAVLAKRDVLPPGAFGQVFRSALRTWPAAMVYDEFAPLLEQKKGAGKEKSLELQRALRAAGQGGVSEFDYFEDAEGESSPAQLVKKAEWDARWLDAAIKADEPDLVCCLARPNHKGAVKYLTEAIFSKNRFQTGFMIEALARCQYPKLTDLFLELVTKRTKNAGAFQYELSVLLESARFLPAADLPKLDAFAAKLDEKLIDKFLEALAPLRPVKSDPSDPSDPSDGTIPNP